MDNEIRRLLALGAIFAAIGVGVGALGAHSLPGYLTNKGFDEAKIEKRCEQCETAVRYQLFHSLGILIIAASPIIHSSRTARVAAWFMVAGIFLFSGSLYAIVFAEAPTHMIVPFGGLAFFASWITLLIAAMRSR